MSAGEPAGAGDPAAPHITWAKGGEAWVASSKDDAIALLSTIPSPPGSRLEGTLAAVGEGALPAPIKVKIHRSKRQDDGRFVLEGRLVDFTRAVRDRVAAFAAGGSST